jgi:hypothetical protein
VEYGLGQDQDMQVHQEADQDVADHCGVQHHEMMEDLLLSTQTRVHDEALLQKVKRQD